MRIAGSGNTGAGERVAVGVRALAAAVLVSLACTSERPQPPEAETRCPQAPLPATRPPDVTDAHRDLATWIAKLPEGAADEVLVAPAGVAASNAAAAVIEGAWRDPLELDVAVVREAVVERVAWMTAQVATGALVEGEAGALASARAIVEAAAPVDEIRIVVEEAALWCLPAREGLYKPPIDRDFDRNRCTSLHAGEVVRVVQRSGDGAWLGVHAGHTTGWLHRPVLTPPQAMEDMRALASGRQVVPLRDDVQTEGGRRVRLGTRLPVTGDAGEDRREVLVATADGLVRDTAKLSDALHEAPLPLTRRALFTAAFAQLDAPYGWGGKDGERDCSQLVRDLFAAFDLQLPRHSGVQALVGTHNIDVSGLTDAEKLAEIERWAARGIVLLYMPGHIMIDLGRDGEHRYAISSIAEFLTPCPGGRDTVHRLDRVAVSTLEVGRGTERTAFIERITRLVVFAPDGAASVANSEPAR